MGGGYWLPVLGFGRSGSLLLGGERGDSLPLFFLWCEVDVPVVVQEESVALRVVG